MVGLFLVQQHQGLDVVKVGTLFQHRGRIRITCDALVVDGPVAWGMTDRHPQWTYLETRLTQEHFGITLPRDVSWDLKELVDQVVHREREHLFRKWFPGKSL